MSTTVDNRVLEMRFDNKQFESGVATTMSTLDKLKKKLNLSGASKGLETVGKTTKKINFSGMTAGINQVKAGMFSLNGISAGVIAKFTVINNLCNSLFHTGKKMMSALTIDPVKTGFQEYETQIGAIQTILSNTRQEGTNVEIVNRALDELNTYADKTIYNFTEMTRNIGTFTAAGVKLDTSVNAIKGIANLAAVSGSTSQQASSAMYQLSQALAAGKVSLMDWNSVVNAGMGGKVFQDALIRTSELLGTGAEAAIEANGSFRESLTQSGWLTTEVLTETLNQLAGTYSKADLMAQGFSESQAAEIVSLAKDAEDAATKVKTFTQLWDVMKEAAQSGWAQTWRLIVGDFEEAKNLLTPLSEFFTGVIGKFSDARNALLQSSIATNVRDMFAGVDSSISKLLGPVEDIKEAFTDLGAIVDEVILGKFGSGETRFDALTEAGYNWMEVQNGVNEKLNNGFRYTEEQISAQNKLLGSQKKITKSTENVSEVTEDAKENTQKLTDAEKHRLQQIAHLSEAQMRANGYTEEQIVAMRDLRKVADQLGIPIVEFIANLDNLNGRWIAIESLKNIGQSILKVFSSLGGAMRDVFEPIQPETIFNTIVAFHKFTETLILSDGNAEKLRNTFKGLFSILDLVTSIVGGGTKFAFKVLSSILGAFNLNILDVTSGIGEAIYSFNKWIKSENIISKELDDFASKLPGYANRLKTWFNAFKETPAIQSFIDAIENIKKAFSDFSIDKIDSDELARKLGENLANALSAIPKAAVQIGKDVIAGFQNGLEEGISGGIIGKIISFCSEFISSFASALGVHSPSVLTYAIGKYVIAGLLLGLVAGFPMILDFLKEKGNDIISAFEYIGGQLIKAFKYMASLFTDESGNIKWDKIFAGGLLIGGLVAIKKFLKAFDNISDAVIGISEVIENAKNSLKKFSKILTGYSWKLKAQAVREISIAIAILSASFILIAKSTKGMKISEMWNVVGIIGALSLVVVGLAGAMELMSKSTISLKKGEGLNIEGLKASILQIGLTILALGFVVKLIGDMPINEAKQGFIGLAAMTGGLIVFMASLGGISVFAKDIGSVGKTMFKLSLAMLLMVGVCKLVSGLSLSDMQNGALFAEGFAIFVLEISAASSLAGEHIKSLGGMLMKLSLAMMLMVGVCKLASKLSPDEMKSGALFAGAFALFVGVLSKISNIGKDGKIAKLGGLLLSISASMLLMMGVAKIGANLNASELLALTGLATGMLAFVGILVSITKIGKEEQIAKLTGMLISISFAVGILAGVSALLGMLDPVSMLQGLAAVSVLSALMVAMTNAAKNAKDAKGSIIAMTAAIGAIAIAVWSLSIMDWKDLLASSGSMVALMGMFALITKNLKGLTKVSIVPILTLTVVIGALAGVIFLMKDIKPESSISSAMALSALLLTMSATLKILNSIGGTTVGALKGIIALTSMAIPLLAFVGVLKLMDGVDSATKNVKSLIVLAGSLTLMLIPLTIMGNFVVAAAAGIIALTSMAIPLLAFVGVLKLMDGVDSATENANMLISFMSIMTDLLVKIAIVGPLAVVGVSAMTGLILLMGAIGTMAVAIGALIDKFPNIKKFLDTGLPLLEQLAGSIGTMIGNFAGGAIEGISGSLPKVGENIADFMAKLATASENASGVKSGSFNGVSELMSVMMDIWKTTVGTTFSDIFTLGGTSMAKFETDGVAFFKAMRTISEASSGVTFDKASVSAVIDIATQLSTLQSSLENMGGVIDWFTGKDDLGTFGTSVASFMLSMKTAFSDIGITTIDPVSLESTIDAAAKLSTLQSSLENMGGVIDWFTGKDDLGTFGEKIGQFATAMSKLKTGMGENGISEGVIASVTNAGRALIALQEALPEEGWFDGKINLDTFSEYINKFAASMSAFSTTAIDIKPDTVNIAITTAYRIKDLINALTDIEISGANIFSGVGAGDGPLVNIGQAIGKFGQSVSEIDTGKVNTAVSTAYRIKALVSELSEFDSSGISKFNIQDLAISIRDYALTVASADYGSIDESISVMNRLKSFINGLSSFNGSGISSFQNALSSLAQTNISGVANAFNESSSQLSGIGTNMISSLNSGFSSGKSSLTSTATTIVTSMLNTINGKKNQFLAAGKMLLIQLNNGVKSQNGATVSAVTSVLGSASSASRNYYSTFYMSGAYVASGFVSGIRNNISAAASAAASMAAAASAAARANLKIHSPSKVFEMIGSFVPKGFANGISTFGGMISRSVHRMTTTAIDATKKTVSGFKDLFNLNPDSNPTIRPVLDLSNIESGAAAISGLLNKERSIETLMNLRSIGSSINSRNQNGSNDDIIAAINSLRKDLRNVGGTSYNINGITYDDGSNINSAIEEIVRAVRIGRRA